MATLEKVCRACGRPRPVSEDFCPYCTAPPPPVPPRKRSPSSTVDTGLETRWGGGPENPTVEEMRAALAELDTPDMEHPNTWLSDDEEWIVDVYEGGLVIFSHEDKVFVSVEMSRVARRLSFGCFYSKEEEMRLDRDYPPNHTLAANGGWQLRLQSTHPVAADG